MEKRPEDFFHGLIGGEELSLAALVEDYVRHLDHHLAQLHRPANPAAAG